MDSKRAQLKLSFGMIFSIILIIVFLGFGFFAIQKFLSFQHDVQIKQFYSSLNEDVLKAYKSTRASSGETYSLPSSVKQVCFDDDNYENVYLYEERPLHGEYVEHLKIDEGFCVGTVGGKVNLILEKNYEDTFVSVRGA